MKASKLVSRFTFYLLAVGSACSLGNVWRFPYVVGENGGGAFILIYIFLAFTVGLSILTAELILGRLTQSSLVKIAQKNSKQYRKSYHWLGRISVLITIIMLAYYSVISGWVLYYLTQFLVNFQMDQTTDMMSKISLAPLKSSGVLQLALASVHLIICGFVVSQGIIQRFEKIFIRILPLLVVLIVVLIYRSISLDSREDVLRFLFYPDFSKLNLSSLGRALGHVFFTLSVGMGILVTYGSFFKDDEHLPSVGLRVTTIDTLISIMALLLIFPVAFAISGGRQISDPYLLFESLPYLFAKIKYGHVFGILFFLCLWLAAVNASLGLVEALTTNVQEYYAKINRKLATSIALLGVFILTLFPAFSGTLLSKYQFLGQSFLENLDSILINYLLPLSALALIFLFFKTLSQEEIRSKFIDLSGKNSAAIYSHWIWTLKWVAPVLIVLALLLQSISVIQDLFA